LNCLYEFQNLWVKVLADSGYDDRDIENIIAEKKWKFIIALKKTRSVKSEKQHLTTPKSRGWLKIRTPDPVFLLKIQNYNSIRKLYH